MSLSNCDSPNQTYREQKLMALVMGGKKERVWVLTSGGFVAPVGEQKRPRHLRVLPSLDSSQLNSVCSSLLWGRRKQRRVLSCPLPRRHIYFRILLNLVFFISRRLPPHASPLASCTATPATTAPPHTNHSHLSVYAT